MVTTGHDGAVQWASDGSQNGVNEDPVRKRWVVNITRMILINSPLNSNFIGHGYLQHAGAVFTGKPAIRFHMYLIPQRHPPKDAVAFSYE